MAGIRLLNKRSSIGLIIELWELILQAGYLFQIIKIADSDNLNYLRINNNKQVDKNIDMVLKNNKPVICELMIDPNQEQMPRALYRWKSKK